MFFITSTMVITTPGTIIAFSGIRYMRYMSLVGLFLFKDVISLGASFYRISYFGKKRSFPRTKASSSDSLNGIMDSIQVRKNIPLVRVRHGEAAAFTGEQKRSQKVTLHPCFFDRDQKSSGGNRIGGWPRGTEERRSSKMSEEELRRPSAEGAVDASLLKFFHGELQ